MEKPDICEEIVRDAVPQIVSLTLEEQLAQDTEAAALNDEPAVLGGKLTDILPAGEGRELPDRYLSVTHTMDGLQQEYLYQRGRRGRHAGSQNPGRPGITTRRRKKT